MAYRGANRLAFAGAGMVLLVVLAAAPALALGWQRAETVAAPAPYVLQVVAEDLDGDGRDELVVAGRDYEQQQDRLHVMGCARDGGSPGAGGPCGLAERLVGPVYTGPLHHVALAAGDLLGTGRPQILLTRGNRLEIWELDGDAWRSLWQGAYPLPVEQVAALAAPDGRVMMVVVGVVTRPRWAKLLEVAGWVGDGLSPVGTAEPGDLVRALTAADLAGDGHARVVVEVGTGNEPGAIEVWDWDGQALRRQAAQAVRDAPVFALAAGAMSPDDRQEAVLVADNRGQVGLYTWSAQGFSLVGEPETLGWRLVSAALGDLDGDGVPEAVVVEYPNWLHLLRWRS